MGSRARASARSSTEGRRAQQTGERQEAYQLRSPRQRSAVSASRRLRSSGGGIFSTSATPPRTFFEAVAVGALGPTRHRLHSGRLKSPIHTATTDAQRRRDVSHRTSDFEELHGLISLEPRRRPPPQVPVLGFRLGNPLALPLKHHLAFELREAGEDSENKLAS